ncbi:MAG: DNA-directed RNA polymerase subunit L [Nanoarchaeota archaeon]|nr:DNA-directed RNA polymerase subunit L [Nanoarchaeota archaeon]|tara:strand:- start:19 stop:291 length:273 start_codon:yes stop_codon:yes gene_type:complete
MELKIIEETKEKIKFELSGEGHTFSNPLSKELWKDSHVKTSGYHIKHSLVSNPIFVVETDGEKPKASLKKAAGRLEKTMGEFLTKFKQLK